MKTHIEQEAELATKQIWPEVLRLVEQHYDPVVEVFVPLTDLIRPHHPHIRTHIISKIVMKLNGLGYQAYGKISGKETGITIK